MNLNRISSLNKVYVILINFIHTERKKQRRKGEEERLLSTNRECKVISNSPLLPAPCSPAYLSYGILGNGVAIYDHNLRK